MANRRAVMAPAGQADLIAAAALEIVRRKKAARSAAASGFRERAAADPARFMTEVLGADLYDRQIQMAESVRDHEQTSVLGCNSAGKDWAVGRIVAWWQASHYPAKTIITGPTSRQVADIVWREVRMAFHGARTPLEGRMLPTDSRWEVTDDHFALGFATDRPHNLTGFHSPNLLVVVTEAHGFSDEHMTMVKRLLPNRLILTGNPFADSGEFFDSHHDKRHLYNAITITAADSPNVKAGREIVPGLVTQADMDKGAADWGRESALYRATFDAEFGLSPDGLLPLAWLMAAKARPAAEDDGVSPVTAGIDVAGPGEDETSLWLRQGPSLIYHQAWVEPDPRGQVVAVLNPYRAQGRLVAVNVDSAGIGYYFGKHLQDLGFKVNMVNVGESARDGEQFANLKAELYWALRMRFQAGDVAGLTDSLALAQLASIRYTHNARGQVVIESKESARKRGVKSPDRAEGIMLAFAPPPPPAVSLVDDRAPTFGRDRAVAGERAGQQRSGFWGAERNGRTGRGY